MDRYLSGKQCLSITNKILYCQYYEGEGNCSECQKGFVLDGNQCV